MRHALVDAASPVGDSRPVAPTATGPEATRALLEVRDLAVSFGRDRPVRVVNEISFEIYPGEALGVVGESGSGKSVTAMSIMGLHRTARVSGSISFDGVELLKLGRSEFRKLRGRDIAMVFQDPMSSLNPIQSVGRQIGEVIETHLGVTRRESQARTIELLELVGITNARHRLRDYPHEFSGGMRQRVMIAMAVSCTPKLLIADEPTTALDVTTQAQVLELLQRLRRDLDMSLMLVTHDFGVVREIADRVNVMYAGTIVESGPADRVVREPWHPYSEALVAAVPSLDDPRVGRLGFIRGMPPDPSDLPPGCPFSPRCAYVRPECSNDPPDRRAAGGSSRCWLPVASLDGRHSGHVASAGSQEPLIESGTEPLLKIEHLSVTYKRRWGFARRGAGTETKAVDDLSLVIHPGETLGLVGESGSGKSTTGRAILRLVPVDSGSIAFAGEDVLTLSSSAMRRLGRSIKIVFQDSVATLDPRMTVAEIVEEPLRIHGVGDHDARLERVQEVLEQVGVGSSFLFRYPHELSGGQRQRVGIARAIALSPRLIVCDEPVSALDVSIQAQVLNLFAELKDELGLTYLFISHDLRVVRQTADRVAVMYRGRILEVADTETLFESPSHPYTQLLLASVPDSGTALAEPTRNSAPDDVDAADECIFAARCPLARPDCWSTRPELEAGPAGGAVACHYAEEASEHWQSRKGRS